MLFLIAVRGNFANSRASSRIREPLCEFAFVMLRIEWAGSEALEAVLVDLQGSDL
jgi:hypothetical protein